MSRSILTVVGVALLAGSAALAAWYLTNNSSAGESITDGAERPRRAVVTAIGRLTPEGGVIDLSGTAGDRLGELLVAEGDEVQSGQELARLATYAMRKSEEKLAEAQLTVARRQQVADAAYGAALVAEAEAARKQLDLYQLDVEGLEAKVSLLEANLKVAQADFSRLQTLRDSDAAIVADQELEHQQLVVEQAKAELASTRLQLAKLEQSHESTVVAADAKLASARANDLRMQNASQVESAEESLEAARARSETSVVRAPRDGRILEMLVEPGETIGQGPILRMGDVDPMYALAEVYETDVRDVRPGQRATVASPALDKPLAGVVETVGVMVAKNQVTGLNPTATTDNRVVPVRIRLDANGSAARLINLQVDVEISTESAESAAVEK